MIARLETVTKSLAEELRSASKERLQSANLAICKMALESSAVLDPEVLSALAQLQKDGYVVQDSLGELKRLQDRYDEMYFDSQDEAADDRDSQVAGMSYFYKARAISALIFAGQGADLTSSMESIYEASMAVEDAAQVYECVRRHLKIDLH